jgi:hypothetical protein
MSADGGLGTAHKKFSDSGKCQEEMQIPVHPGMVLGGCLGLPGWTSSTCHLERAAGGPDIPVPSKLCGLKVEITSHWALWNRKQFWR